MDIITADLECYYDNTYSLSKLSTEEYLRSTQFEPILWAVKVNDSPAFWLLPDRFSAFVKNEVNWATTALLAHHCHFDGAALAWHYGVHPALLLCTLSMARVIDGPKAGNSLQELCARHGIGAKGNYVTYAKGKHLADFSRDELMQYGAYSCNDTERTYDLAQLFLPHIPESEIKLISLTVKMFTEPALVGDVARLQGAVVSERARKKEILAKIGLLCQACGGSGMAPLHLLPAEPCKFCDGSGLNKKPLNSNDQFAELLRARGVEPETKPSPTSGEQIFAFAKTDSAMQELLEDEEEEVRALAEARIAVKSNIIETRAERFAGSAARGAMPVYISYGAAHTLRWGGGDKMNWQNLSNYNENRPEMSVIKASIHPPTGHKIVVVDSAQGEARILAWLAGQQDLVDAFAQGRDVYSEHASTIYSRPVDRKRVKEDYIPGQLGKVCLAEGTLVITNTGTKPIERVTLKDMLWDGEEWIHHQGLIFQGVKQTFGHAAFLATGDHEILTERGWLEWRQVITNPSLFQSALSSANLPFLAGGGASPLGGVTNTKHYVDAPAGQKHTSLDTPSKAGALHGAMPALRKLLLRSVGGVTQKRWLMSSIDRGYLVGWMRRLADATTLRIGISNTMASAASQYAMNGAQIRQHSYDISKPAWDGISPPWKWIVRMWMEVISRVTFDSSLVPSIYKTNDRLAPCSDESKNSKQKMRTYDLACAGPRRRFTVLTNRGPIIVHNCILGMGYGMGWARASAELLKGMLGAPPIQFTFKDMETLSVDPSRFLNNPNKVARVAAMPSRLELNDRLIHCCVTESLIHRYRQKYEFIPAYWSLMDGVISAMLRGEEMEVSGIMRTGKDCLWMPNGLPLHYRGLERSDDGQASYFDGRKRVKLHGSLLTENIDQCLHRILVAGQMLEIADAGIKVALMTHDDVAAVVPEDAAELTLQFMVQAMGKVPSWAAGLPLKGEGEISDTLLGGGR